MSIDYYFNVLQPEFKVWAVKHIKEVKLSSEVQTAGVQLTEKGYILHLSEKAFNLKGKTRAALLMHELSHVWRGDCLVKDVNPKVWNIAADAAINFKLNSKDFESLKEAFGGGVDWEELKKDFEKVQPKIPPSTQVIYDLLLEKGVTGEGSEDHFLLSTGDENECAKHHVRAILDAPNVGASLSIKTEVRKGFTITPKSEPRVLQALRMVLQTLQPRYGATLARTRSWMREGRTPCMRGHVTAPRYRVACLVDVSGSMSNLIPQVIGIAAGMNRETDCRIMLWASSAAWISSPRESPNVGGGTDINAALTLSREWKPDSLIVLTDGCFFEAAQVENLPPIIWVLTLDERQALSLRGKDRVVKL